MVPRTSITTDRLLAGAPPSLPTAVMLTDLRARLERQRPHSEPDPLVALLFSLAFVALGVVLASVGV